VDVSHLQNPLKILIAHNNYQQRGGEDFVVEQETELLRSHGHQVFTLRENNNRILSMSTFDLARIVFWNQQTDDSVRAIIERENIDLVHVHNYFPLISPAIFQAASECGVAVVHTAHNYRLICVNALLFRDGKTCRDCVSEGNFLPGVMHRCYRESYAASAFSAISLGWHQHRKTITDSVDRFIALSAFAADELANGGIQREKIAVKPNFVISDVIPSATSGDYVVIAGRLTAEKGMPMICKSWGKLQTPIPLRIAGDGTLRSDIVELARSNENAHYEGWLEEPALLELIRNARILLFPSLMFETAVAVSVIQALSAGTPVIISDVCAAAPIIVKSGAGTTFKSGDPDDLLRVVEALWHDESRLQEMRRSARALYESTFTAEAAYERMIEIYKEAMEARAARKVAPA
jgi:glycosyltransferase involved in cell wall biosynthesis